jgi:prephenate dehydrogenase
MSVLVVGTGLVGTSIGLALRDSARVLLADREADHLGTAVRRGAGEPWDEHERVALVVVATPPRAIARVIHDLAGRDVADTFTHVASVQSRVQADIEALGAPLAQVCGGHPLAGREVRGPAAATARLFADRPWAICPSAGTSPQAVAEVGRLAEWCGAVPVVLPGEEHDAAVALVSHLPQLVSTALAAQLDAAPQPGQVAGRPSELAGPALQEMTRIAASDPSLWVDILAANAGQVAPLAHALAADLTAAAEALDALAAGGGQGAPSAAAVLQALLTRGNRGRARVPLKTAPARASLVPVVVVVRDQPGQLAELLATAARAGVNVEDVRVEHVPGRARGRVELLVTEPEQQRARASLAGEGWDVVSS